MSVAEHFSYLWLIAIFQRLRERVTQLDLENTALARAARGPTENEDADDANLDVQALVDKIVRLKGMLKLANERSEKPVNIDGKICFIPLCCLLFSSIVTCDCDNIKSCVRVDIDAD